VQGLHAVGHLRTESNPVFETLDVDPKTLFATPRKRIEETETLDEPAVTRTTLVRNGDVIERALLAATARQSDDYHGIPRRIVWPSASGQGEKAP
tara:strand:+ start:797 stop:1081 length:285 start_codon:yes stop_codon:yes gene_type:complete